MCQVIFLELEGLVIQKQQQKIQLYSRTAEAIMIGGGEVGESGIR